MASPAPAPEPGHARDPASFIDQCGYMYLDGPQISKTLICSICSEPWTEPLVTSGCGHVFCSPCILTWLRHVSSCPNDRTVLTPELLSPAPRILRELVDELTVICSFGCGWQGRRDEWKSHLESACPEARKMSTLSPVVSAARPDHSADMKEEEDSFEERWKALAREVHLLKKEAKENHDIMVKWKDKVSQLQLQLQQMNESPSVLNSQTPAPGRADVVHPATCDFCRVVISGTRYKCLKCPDLDACSSCYQAINQLHPVHDFVPIRNPGDVTVVCLPEWKIVHPNVICNNCRRGVIGPRFKCVICTDYDLCHHCMALPRSPHPIGHPMTRFINP